MCCYTPPASPLRINHRLCFACSELTEACLVVLQCLWPRPPSMFLVLQRFMCLPVCACLRTDGGASVYLLHLQPCHSSSRGRVRGTEESFLDRRHRGVRSRVSVTVARSGVSSRASAANGIINFPSKPIAPSRVKGGELWRENALMAFMTLQIMHYRQEQSGDSKHNCIDFLLMATNNDISLDPGEEQDGFVKPGGARSLRLLDPSSGCLLKTLYHRHSHTRTQNKHTFRSSYSPIYALETHWHACGTQTQIYMDTLRPTHTHTHTQIFITPSPLQLLSFPRRFHFRWNVSFNGNGNGITKSTFSYIAFSGKREKVFLLDGTTRAYTLPRVVLHSPPRQMTWLL